MSRRGANEGSIYRRKDGRWVTAIDLGRENGKRQRKYVYGRTYRDVLQQRNAAVRDRERGVLHAGRTPTVEQYLTHWLQSAKPTLRPKSFETYAINVRRMVPYLGHHRLNKLTPSNVQSCYAGLLERLSARSVEQAHTVLHRALRMAVRQGLIGMNPSDAVDVPRPVRREMRTLSPDQLELLFGASERAGDRLHALWVLLATTGLRLGEATGLRWSDVDLDTGRTAIQRALQRQREAGLVFVEPKSSRSRRTVHLARFTVSTLREHRRQQIEARLAAGPEWDDQDLVFSNVRGGPIDPAKVTVGFQRALDRAELPRVRVHDLRHTAATLLLQRGVHPKVVQDLLGHSTIALTLDTYSHVMPALHAEVAEHMDAVFADRASAAAERP